MTGGSKLLERNETFGLGSIDDSAGRGLSGQQWIQLARRASRSNCPILISGETGVGKEHLASWLHANSRRKTQPFIPVNCGAVPESLIDSHLFGHLRGAFSGAETDHLGLVRAAEGGTLFLDEVSELTAPTQTRLLRLLQHHEVQPVGRSRPVLVDVRILAATNRDLYDAVAASQFREDLLYRLDVVQLRVKPLRQRLDELPGLLKRFNAEFAQLYDQLELQFDRAAINLLQTYRWPGNIRQLRSVVERLHVLCPGKLVSARQLIEFGQLNDATSPRSPRHMLQQVKREAVQRVLEDSSGSVSRAAAVFGVHRSTIYRWLKLR